jgi:hypothetical protein
MRVLVFDTETTGLPKSKFISPDTLHLWPDIVQCSFIIYDTDLMTLANIQLTLSSKEERQRLIDFGIESGKEFLSSKSV